MAPLPSSYATLPTQHLKVSHVPASSSTPTQVIVITLNRPDKLNAFTEQMVQDFELVYGLVDVDPRVKCVVLTGAGKGFCAGMDLQMGFPDAKGEKPVKPKRPREADSRDTYVAPHHSLVRSY